MGDKDSSLPSAEGKIRWLQHAMSPEDDAVRGEFSVDWGISVKPITIDGRITRDVIFLLQSRRLVLKHLPAHWVEVDGETLLYDASQDWIESGPECGEKDDEGDVTSSYFELTKKLYESASEFVYEHWETEHVFLSGEEAKAYGESHAYNYRYGWRSYGIVAKGVLASLLSQVRSITCRGR